MNRRTIIIPRLIMLGLIGVAIWLGKDPLIRSALLRSAQQQTGAKVEIAQLRTSAETGQLFLKNLKVTDPREPMRNFLQADLAHLTFDTRALWHANFVIEEGRTSHLMFNAPRTESGALPATHATVKTMLMPTAPPLIPTSTEDLADQRLMQIGQAWLDHLQPPTTATPLTESESVRVAQQLRPQWQPLLTAYAKKITTLNPSIEQLRSSLKTEFHNPLRDPVLYESASAELKRLEQQSIDLRAELEQQLLAVSQAKQKLHAAQAQDQQRIGSLTQANQFDHDRISELLLHRSQQQLADEVVQWFRWFRESVPQLPAREVRGLGLTGQNIQFVGSKRKPQLLVKRLELEGEGRLLNQNFNFVGTAYDLTTQPDLHDKPASLELRAQGNQHLSVQCEIDRRGEQPIDHLTIHCPDFLLPAQKLGHDSSLLVSLGPNSRVNANIEIRCVGDELSGTITMAHSNVALHVDQLNSMAGGADTAMRINQDLIQLNRFVSKIELQGTLDECSFVSTSDLGNQLAATVDRVVIGHFQQQTNQQSTQTVKIVASEIQHLETVVEPELNRLVGQLQQQVERIASMRDSLSAPQNQAWPKIR